jgi:hypothetical protein
MELQLFLGDTPLFRVPPYSLMHPSEFLFYACPIWTRHNSIAFVSNPASILLVDDDEPSVASPADILRSGVLFGSEYLTHGRKFSLFPSTDGASLTRLAQATDTWHGVGGCELTSFSTIAKTTSASTGFFTNTICNPDLWFLN